MKMRKLYKDIFPDKNTLIVVIHVVDGKQLLRNIQIAIDEGAKGAFLISHGDVNWEKLAAMLVFAKSVYFQFNFGINFLDLGVEDAMRGIPLTSFGLWADNAMVYPKEQVARNNWAIRNSLEWSGLYFGGFAFKYQQQPSDIKSLAKIATRYMDVVTTSGDATGKSPSIEKIASIRASIGDFPLAIASGMTPENVGDYRDLVDCFLVSTGISKDFYNLDPEKVARFVKAIS